MSSEISLVTAKPYRSSVNSNFGRYSVGTDRLFESLREEQFSSNQKAARKFIEQTLSLELSSKDLHEVLKDGVLLCSLMNRLMPNVIPQISRKDLPFVKMENISNFLNAARQLGLHTSDLFQTVDLFEGKHMERVVATILAIARVSEGKDVRNSDVSIEQPKLNKLKDLDIKKFEKPDSVKMRESEKLSVNEKLDSNNNNNNNHNHNNAPSESEKTLVDNDPDPIIHQLSDKDFSISDSVVSSVTDHSRPNFGKIPQRKKPSLRKSVTMGQLFTQPVNQEKELADSKFAEEISISPELTQSEKPVSQNSSRPSRKTHVRYKSDRTSEILPSKNHGLPIYDDYKKYDETGDSPREKLVLRNDDEIIAQYQLGNCIGKGQFGAVYRALNLGTGQMVAVKRIKLEGRTPDEIEQLMQEVELLKSLSHPSVVKYEAFIMTDDHINIILEYVENGSLSHTLKSFGNFPEKLVGSYVVKMLEGLVYLHNKQVVHCDLKAANILTTKNGNVKLSDFGVSLNLKMMENVRTDVAGTPNWMAPEVIELKGASTASDIWSLGCTIVELLTGKPPYSDLLAMTALFRIVEDDCPPLPGNISDDLTDFLKQCFRKNANMRPTARDLFRHDWIKNNWSLKELRTQESLPFLRRITSDTDLPSLKTSNNSNFNDDIIENSNNESYKELESTIPPFEKPSSLPATVAAMPQSAPTKLLAATPMVPHRFVKNSFGKPVVCKICQNTVKKHAVMCEECNMVCHSKCSPEAPFPCSLQNHMIRYIPLELIDDQLPRINSTGASSESDVPTITSPINSLATTSPPTPPKRGRFPKKGKKEDSVNSQLSITDSVDSSASVASSSRPGSPNTADSSWGNNGRRFSMMIENLNNYNNNNNSSNNNNNNGSGSGSGKGSGKGKAGKLRKSGSNGGNSKNEDCAIM